MNNSSTVSFSLIATCVAVFALLTVTFAGTASAWGTGGTSDGGSGSGSGGDGCGGCDYEPEPEPEYNPPTYNPPTYNPPTYNPPTYNPPPFCTVYINPDVVNMGDSATITWTSSNATSATVTDFGSEPVNNSRTISNITATKTYTVTVYGPGGSAQCHDTVIVHKPVPVCTIYANPSTIQNGGSSTLTWTSENATSASINHGIGSVSVDGTRSVSPTGTITYTLTVTGPGGAANCQTTIIVQNQLPSCTFTINPHSVQYGGSATATWTSQNATSASINHGIGSVALNGSHTATNLTSTRTYVMTVTGPGGTATCQDTITVEQQTQTPYCTLNINPHSVQYNGSATAVWTSQNATSATLTDYGTQSVNGSRSISNITSNKTYVLTVTGPGGTATCQDSVVVEQQYQNPYCTINANPTSINQGGSSYITWSSSNATSANLSTIGSVGVNGSQTVYPYQTTTYILTVYGHNGQSAQCQTTIYLGTVYNNPPSCWITISTQYSYDYNYGNQQATLSWGSTNATSAYINPNVGSVSTYGSRMVYNAGNQVYTMTVYGNNGQSATCQTQSTYVPPTYYPPQVALTQIPYTGLDLGDTGTILYYFAMLAFAVAALYLAIYYIPAFAGLKARIGEERMEAPMIFAQRVAASVPFARTSQFSNSFESVSRDSMSFARSENGSAPRIVIQRN